MKKKRQINSGLKAWNEARSFFSKENKKAGKKFNGVELNALTKSFLLENYGKSFDKEDLDNFIKIDIPNFYDNIFDVTIDDLSPVVYFMIDNKISSMPKNVTILVDAGEFGLSEFNSSDYNYYESGVKDIVESIRDEVGNDSENIQFSGSIEKFKGKPKNSKKEEDYYIKWTLEGYGSEPKYAIVPKIEETRILPPSELAKARKKKVSKKVKEKVKERKETREVLKENKELKAKLKEKEKEIQQTSKQVSQMQQQMLEMQKQMLEMQKQLSKLNKKK